jgi:hypothetical protein
MERRPTLVRQKLREAILRGYHPYYSSESAEDHWVDWLQIPEQEFNSISDAAMRERDDTLQTKD